MQPAITTIFFCIIAYLLGSVPFGLVLTRLFSNADIRREGSGNIGATNVRRTAGPLLGLLTLLGDVAKGALPVYLSQHIPAWPPGWLETAGTFTALSAFLGHLFPLYLKFKTGGKGVATAGGGFGVLSPPAILVAVVLFIGCVFISRKVSLGSLTAALSLPITTYCFSESKTIAAGAALAAIFIVLRHRDNIRRLVAGTEPSIGTVKRH